MWKGVSRHRLKEASLRINFYPTGFGGTTDSDSTGESISKFMQMYENDKCIF